MAKGDFSGYVLMAPTPDNQAPIFLTEGDLKDLMADPAESYGVQNFLEAPPADPDPNTWGEGNALLMRVKFATLEPVKTVTEYEVRLAE